MTVMALTPGRTSKQEVAWGAGDKCVTVAPVAVHRGQNLDSVFLAELPVGMSLEVLEVSQERRLKVMTLVGKRIFGQGYPCSGWINCESEHGRALLRKLKQTNKAPRGSKVQNSRSRSTTPHLQSPSLSRAHSDLSIKGVALGHKKKPPQVLRKAKSQEVVRCGRATKDAGTPASVKPRSFNQAVKFAEAEGKFLLVSVQDGASASSYRSQRRIWNDEKVQACLRTHFVLWQFHNSSSECIEFCRRYNYSRHLPLVCAIEPHSGECLQNWNARRWVNAEIAAESLLAFITEQLPTASFQDGATCRRSPSQMPCATQLDIELGPTGGGSVCPFAEISAIGLEHLVSACQLAEADCVYDVGCGRGNIMDALLSCYPCRGVGVEINPSLARVALQRLMKYGERVKVVVGDVRRMNLQEATVIVTCFTSNATALVKNDFLAAVRPTCVWFNYGWPVPGWKTARPPSDGVYQYVIGDQAQVGHKA